MLHNRRKLKHSSRHRVRGAAHQQLTFSAKKALKVRFLGAESASSPINTCASSYEINSKYFLRYRPIRITDRKGQATSISYTQRGQVASITSADRTISYQYDATGRTIEVRDQASVNTIQYDAAGRTIETLSTTAAGSHKLQYQYDSLDRVIQRTLSGTGIAAPEVTSYSWDLAGRLLGHSTNIAGQAHATSYQYDVAGRLAARKVQAGSQTDLITQRYGYDPVERLAQIKYIKAEGTGSEQLIEQLDYSYDAAGRRTSKTALNNNGMGASETPMTASYDAANRMSQISLNIAGQTQTYALTYDTNGNLTSKQNTAQQTDKTLYTWDASNRLSQIAQTGATAANSLNASFTYDAFGRRIQSSIATGNNPAQTVQYLYEGAQSLGEIRNGALTNRLLTGLSLDETIARIAISTNGQKDAANSRIYLTDALNSVIAQLSDDNANPGALQNSYGYSPYGETVTVGPDSTSNPVQYTSRENDGTGLYFYRNRYYDPALKRFVSRDPIGLAGGHNEHAYVGGDPVSLTDPSGLDNPGMGPAPDKPGMFPGPSACEYYEKKCKDSCGEDKYACEAKQCCESFGDNFLSNCTRKCLIDQDKGACSKLSGKKRDSCRKQEHYFCYAACGNVVDAIAGGFGTRPPPACKAASKAIGGMW